MRPRNCPLCSGDEYRTTGAGRHEVLRCVACGIRFLAEFPSADDRRSQYQEDYYEADTGSRFLGIFERVVRWFRAGRMRDVLRKLGRRAGGRALDVGCGRGFLLDCFKRAGWDAQGTQLSDTARVACERQFGVTVHAGEITALDLPTADFDVITFYHVLEHVAAPIDYLKEARRILRRDGMLVVEVPDGASPAARFLGSRDLCFDFPHHLFFFSLPVLRRLIDVAGFDVIAERRFSLEYSPFTTLQNILNCLPGKANRLYRSFMRNPEGARLRREPLTWLHGLLGIALVLPAATISLAGLIFPVGNTLRIYARPALERVAERTGDPIDTPVGSAVE